MSPQFELEQVLNLIFDGHRHFDVMSSLLTESLGLHIQRPPSGDNQHAAIELQGRQLEEITIDEKRLITLLSHVPTGPFYVWTSMPPAVDKTKPYSNSIQVPGLVSSAAVSR